MLKDTGHMRTEEMSAVVRAIYSEPELEQYKREGISDLPKTK